MTLQPNYVPGTSKLTFYSMHISCQSHVKFNLTFFSLNRRLQASAVGQERELAGLLDLPWRGRPGQRRRLGHRGSHRPEQESRHTRGRGVPRVHGEKRKNFIIYYLYIYIFIIRIYVLYIFICIYYYYLTKNLIFVGKSCEAMA